MAYKDPGHGRRVRPGTLPPPHRRTPLPRHVSKMRRGPARGRITACASVAARSGARPSAQGARRPGQPAYFTPAEMPNGAAGARVTGASGATGHGREAGRCTRCAKQQGPLKAARCASPVARRGVNASGNNMPRGVQLASAADAVRPPPRQRALRTVRQERGQTLKEEGEERPRPPALRPAPGARALHRLRRTGPGRGPVPGVRPPLVPALGRASRPADPAASLHGHRDRDGR